MNNKQNEKWNPDEKTREFMARKDHFFHACGDYPNRISGELLRQYEIPARSGMVGSYGSPAGISRAFADMAWVVMLYEQELIPLDTAQKLLIALEEAKNDSTYWGEDWLRNYFNGDERIASSVNLGRTLQEPMSRIQLRNRSIEFFDVALDTMSFLLDYAKEKRDLVFAAHTHMSQAQPTTYGAYLAAIFDALLRGMEEVETGYRHTNISSAGCGALEGSGWPVDRKMVADLLGFDGIIGSSYDCEAGQDYATSLLFGLTSIAVVMSRTSMDHEIWGTDEIGYFRVNGCVAGPSSLMPQKAHAGGELEKVRFYSNDVMNALHRALLSLKGEPYEDILPIYQAWGAAESGLYLSMLTFRLFRAYLENIQFNKEHMLKTAAEGYSCMPDMAVYLIKNRGLAGRHAHRICATTTFLARKKGIKGNEITPELMNEALELNQDPLRDLLTLEEIRECLDPVKSILRHNNIGDPHPDEVLRQIEERRGQLAQFRARQEERKAKLKQGDDLLNGRIKAILEA